jgi:urease accessory protein
VRVGVGGAVGSGKTALVERMTTKLVAGGWSPGIVANDIFTQEDALILRRALHGVVDAERIVGVETGACPHSAVREDPTANLAAIAALTARFPDIDLVLIESGGDNLTLTFSPLLADFSIYVLDTAAGDKMPRKQGPGMIQADLLVVNKVDLAPHVGADLSVLDSDARAVRPGPILYTDCRSDTGVDAVVEWLVDAVAVTRGGSREAALGYGHV